MSLSLFFLIPYYCLQCIKNKGNIQSGKGKRGDLLIQITIKSHPIWKVKGLDILLSNKPLYIHF